MSDERIDIRIQDSISSSIKTKIQGIATASREADSAVAKLKATISSLDASAVTRLATEISRLNTAQRTLTSGTTSASTASVRLATAQARLSAATARTSAAQSAAAASASRAQIAALRLTAQQNLLTTSANNSNRAFGGLASTMRSYLAIGFGAALALTSADAYTVLQNKLKNVTDTEADLVAVTEEVFRVANEARVPVSDVTQSFQRFDLALKGLGASQSESIKLTETISKALTLSGATVKESSAALLQLSQAFNKGKLDGDEFRSVMELIPTAADAIAKELSVTRGELLALAPQGKITAEVMRQAFKNSADAIDASFGKTTVTIGQSLSILKNNFIKTFGEVNKDIGITSALASIITVLANNLSIIGVVAATASAGLLVAFGPAILAAILSATTAAWGFAVALAANPIGAVIVVIAAAASALYAFGDEITLTSDGVVTLMDAFVYAFDVIKSYVSIFVKFWADSWNAALSGVDVGGFISMFADGLNAVISTARSAVNFVIGYWVGAISTITKAWSLFPAALADIMKSAFNGVLSIVEYGVNGVLAGLNSVLDLANEASQALGGDALFDTTLSVDLSGAKAQLSGAASEVGQIASQAFTESFNRDYVGEVSDTVSAGIREVANNRISSEETGTLRGASARTTPLTTEKKSNKVKKTRVELIAELNEQLDREYTASQRVGAEVSILNSLDSISAGLKSKNVILTAEETSAIKDKLKVIESESKLQAILQGYYDANAGAMADLHTQQTGITEAFATGLITADQYGAAIAGVTSEISDLKIQLGSMGDLDYLNSAFGEVADGFTSITQSMSDSFDTFTASITSGFSSSVANMLTEGDNFADSFRSVLSQAINGVIASIVQMGIQWLATEALKLTATNATTTAAVVQGATVSAVAATSTVATTTALAASTTASTAAAVTTTAAWTPAAIVSSIGSFGTAAAVGLAAVVAALAFSGFESGGYTGNGGTSDVAGVVHGKEFVMNASAVSRLGVGTLEALQNGSLDPTQGASDAVQRDVSGVGSATDAFGSRASAVQQSTSVATDSGGSLSTSDESTRAAVEAATPNVNMQSINVLDPDLVGDYISSSSSDEVFINKISRNKSAIKSAIG